MARLRLPECMLLAPLSLQADIAEFIDVFFVIPVGVS